MTQPLARIALFGAVEIIHDRAAPTRPSTQRVLTLLGYLVTHHDIPQSRDKLVDILWPDLLPRQGRRLLSDTLWRTRRLLTPPGQDDTPALQIDGNMVAFRSSETIWVDLLAFERFLQAPAGTGVEHLRAAVDLYRGDFMEECYDDWALYERERLREQYLSALQLLLAHDQERGAFDRALQYALRLVQADPLREEVHRALMRVYYLLGREADAIRAFEQCRDALMNELGVEPEPETISLYEEIDAIRQHRAGQRAAAVGAPSAPAQPFAISNNLPFVGRQAARAEVMEAVEQAQAGLGGLLLVAGLVGQGKSRLLREAASGAEWRGAQVSWGYAREDAEALPYEALRQALEAALTPLRARQLAEQLPAHTLSALLPLLPHLSELLPNLPLLASDRAQSQAGLHVAIASTLAALGQIAPQVLILEDMHWFDSATLEALAAVAPILSKARMLIVISGRTDELQQQAAAWDCLLRFDRAGMLRRIELRGMNAEECADLVRRALGMPHPAPHFSARLAEATGGNPFFILETLRALYEQGTLARDARGVWHTPWDAPGADYHELVLPDELRQAIDKRLSDLPAPARATLAAAAVLGQNFTPTTLARMADGATPSPELLRRQFLVEDSAGYRFSHDSLREVVYSELDESTRRSLHLRAAEVLEQEHYDRVEALAQHLYLAGAWNKAIPHLIQAGDHARALYAYRDAQRNYDQALEAYERSPRAAISVRVAWDIQLKRATVATQLSEYPAALASYEALLELIAADEHAIDAATRFGARRSAQIQALNGLAYVYGLINDYTQARAINQRAMALAAESPRLQDRGDTFYQAGQIGYHMNSFDEALDYLKRAYELYEAVDAQHDQARCLELLAWILRRQAGVTDQVVTHLQQALEIYRALGDDYRERHCRVSLANVHLLRGAFDDVLQECAAVLPFFRATDARYTIAECQYLRGVALYTIGQLPEALQALDETVAICLELGITAAVEVNLLYRGQVLRALERYDEGLRDLEAASATDDRLVKPRALIALAELWLDRHELLRAFESVAQAIALVREVGSKPYLGVALRLLGQVRAADASGALPARSDALPDAEACFQSSIELLTSAQYDSDLGLAYAHYGAYVLARQRGDEARVLLLQAQALARRCGMQALQATIQRDLQNIVAESVVPTAGQVRVRLARQGAPRGRPLRTDEVAEIIWTVTSTEDVNARELGGKVAERQLRIRRLCAEALAQGAEPTVADLATALGVTSRTVDRDIAALRASGEQIATRGAA